MLYEYVRCVESLRREISTRDTQISSFRDLLASNEKTLAEQEQRLAKAQAQEAQQESFFHSFQVELVAARKIVASVFVQELQLGMARTQREQRQRETTLQGEVDFLRSQLHKHEKQQEESTIQTAGFSSFSRHSCYFILNRRDSSFAQATRADGTILTRTRERLV